MSSPASVIIPNLDCPLVDLAVEAVMGQEQRLEVVVVGRDAPGRLRAIDGIRRIETPEPLSPAAARNLGVARATGEHLLFTDADCRPGPGWAARLLAALEQSPVVGGAVGFSLRANRWAVADNIASFHDFLPDRPRQSRSEGPLGTLNLAMTRAAWEATGRFDEELPTSEDHDWVLRARAAGLATGFEPAAVVEHAAVRRSRRELADHAAWYGRHFGAFRAKHPGAFGAGPTWRSRRRLALAAPAKSLSAALSIFARHRCLLPGWRAFPGVVGFKLAWYRAVVAHWPGG